MIVNDATTQNEILEGCGCCPMPTCPVALMDIEIRSHYMYFVTPPYPSTAADALTQLFDYDWDSVAWDRIYSQNPFSLATGPSGFGGAGVEWLPGLPVSAGVGLAYGTQFRYRRRVPFSHSGSYFKFAWNETQLDYTCFPQPAFPGSGFWFEQYGNPACFDPKILTPKEYIWIGPGTEPKTPDNPSWYSDWSDPVYMPSGVAGVVSLQDDAWNCYKATQQGIKPNTSPDIAIYFP